METGHLLALALVPGLGRSAAQGVLAKGGRSTCRGRPRWLRSRPPPIPRPPARVQKRLETFVEHVSIPPALIFGIVQASAWLSNSAASLSARLPARVFTGHSSDVGPAASSQRQFAVALRCRLQGEMGEEFVGHLEALAAKLEYVGGDDTARFSAAYRHA